MTISMILILRLIANYVAEVLSVNTVLWRFRRMHPADLCEIWRTFHNFVHFVNVGYCYKFYSYSHCLDVLAASVKISSCWLNKWANCFGMRLTLPRKYYNCIIIINQINFTTIIADIHFFAGLFMFLNDLCIC